MTFCITAITGTSTKIILLMMKLLEGHIIFGDRVTDHTRNEMKNEVKYRNISVKQEPTKGQDEHLHLSIPTHSTQSQHLKVRVPQKTLSPTAYCK